jgi:hypothetical protein
MMSPEAIRSLSREKAAEAAKRNLKPFVVDAHDLADWLSAVDGGKCPKIPVPFLGYHVPDGWEMDEDTYFVDSTGWDVNDAGGPAMSVGEFVRALEPGVGYAVIEAGEFQVVVAKYRRLN